MRNPILALTLALTLGSGTLAAAKETNPKPDVGPGRIAWFDIATTDMTRAKEFYSKLFDWHFTAVAGAGDLAAEIVASGTPIGTLRRAEGKLSPYDGVVYVQVTDMLASCKKAKELGGTIPPGFPFNLQDDRGAIALVVDPAGHPVGLYSRTPLPPRPTAAR